MSTSSFEEQLPGVASKRNRLEGRGVRELEGALRGLQWLKWPIGF